MKKLFKFHFYVLRSHTGLLLLLIALALAAAAVLGIDALHYAEAGYYGADSESLFAYICEDRRIMGLIGAPWCCVFIGYDFKSSGINTTVYKGGSRQNIFLSKYLLLILSCFAISLFIQTATLLIAFKGHIDVPPLWLLRCIGVRIFLDMGVMLTPSVVIYALKNTTPAFLICLGVGLLFYFKSDTNYSLWLSNAEQPQGLKEFWPVLVLPVSAGASYNIWIHTQLK